MNLNNMPKTKIGIVAVSRDCFPESLSVNRRKALVEAYTKKYGADDIYECPVCIVESEIQMVEALEDIKKAGCDSLCVYLGNFGPEISETLLAKHFDGPVMFCAAAEESGMPVTLWLRSKSALAASEVLRGTLHYLVDENGFTVSQGEESANLPWDQIYKMVATKSNVLVYSTRINAYIIPREQLGEQYKELAKIANEKLPKHRVKMQ